MEINERFWVKQVSQGIFEVGLTKNFLERVGIIWNLIPRVDLDTVNIEQPFAAFESSKCLTSLQSPVAGQIVEWNQMAINKPHEIKDFDFLIKVRQ